jgi:hypothetical protein
MADRFDVLSPRPRKGSDRPYWHKVGTAWQNERGINIVFDSLPLPDAEGRVSVSLFEPREPQQSSGQQRQQSESRSRRDEPLDDDVPF